MSSERTPTLQLIAGTGKPRLIVNLPAFYSSEGPVLYSPATIELPEATGLAGQLQPGQRITAWREIGSAPPVQTVARILEIDGDANRIAIGGWSNGQPDCIPAAPSAFFAGPGSISEGTRQYRISFVVDGRETPCGFPSVPVSVVGGAGRIEVNVIPVRDTGIYGECMARRLYRTKADGDIYFLVAEIGDNFTTYFTDNIGDDLLFLQQTEQVVPGFVVDGWIADLPRCQEVTETFEPFTVIHRLFRGTTQVKLYGWKYGITLDYGKYLSADAFAELRRQLHAAPDGSLVLIPRRDAPQVQYNVYFDEPFSLARYGRSPGYRKIVLKFFSRELVPGPVVVEGYGSGYALNYGNEM